MLEWFNCTYLYRVAGKRSACVSISISLITIAADCELSTMISGHLEALLQNKHTNIGGRHT